MVPGGRIEPPTQGFSGLCSTTELPRQITVFLLNKNVCWVDLYKNRLEFQDKVQLKNLTLQCYGGEICLDVLYYFLYYFLYYI